MAKSKSDKSSKLKEIEGRFEDLRIQELFRKALIHDGFFGVGHIFIYHLDHAKRRKHTEHYPLDNNPSASFGSIPHADSPL